MTESTEKVVWINAQFAGIQKLYQNGSWTNWLWVNVATDM